MWGALPLFLADSAAITVSDLSIATSWYKEKLALQLAKAKREDDSPGSLLSTCTIRKRTPALLSWKTAPGMLRVETSFSIFRTWMRIASVCVEPQCPTRRGRPGGSAFLVLRRLQMEQPVRSNHQPQRKQRNHYFPDGPDRKGLQTLLLQLAKIGS
jgi:hypothetical protein